MNKKLHKIAVGLCFLVTSVLVVHADDPKDMKADLAVTPSLRTDQGLYVAAYGGAQFDTDYGNQHRNITLNPTGENHDIPMAGTGSGWGGVGGIKLGYNFNSFLICEGLSLQPAAEFEALYLGTTSKGFTHPGVITENTSYNNAAWFANGIVRFKLDCPLTPYIGAGVGGEYITTHANVVADGGPVLATGLNGSDVDFAFQALIGFDYALTPHWTLFTEYKFIDALDTKIKYNNFGGEPETYRFEPDQIMQDLITAGVKYNF